MIELRHKADCSGCSACEAVCPVGCIRMKSDREGFAYPAVDKSRCIHCGLCEKVCPFINSKRIEQDVRCYAMRHADEAIREKSSSGGAFSYFAETVLRNGGVVFGARFDDQWRVRHDYTETVAGLDPFRGSKYVQSDMSGVMPKVREFLDSGRQVLFCGTPCQVTGLKNYLRKPYDNLLTIDFICHGVPSPKVWAKYLDEVVARQCDQKNTVSLLPIHTFPESDTHPVRVAVEGVNFREKSCGWKKYSFALSLSEATAEGKKNSVSLSYSAWNNDFMKSFLHDLALRPSCYSCKMRKQRSKSDITIADFWCCDRVLPELDDDKGVSAVIIRNPKCLPMVDGQFVEVSYADILTPNQALIYSPIKHHNRSRFFSRIDDLNVIENINRNYQAPRLQNVEAFIRRVARYIKKKL